MPSREALWPATWTHSPGREMAGEEIPLPEVARLLSYRLCAGLMLGALLALAFSASSAGASPASTAATPTPGQRSIVVLRASVADPAEVAARHARVHGLQVGHVYRSALKGYSATIPSSRIAAVQADPTVQFISPDTEVRALAQAPGTGISRIRAVNKANKGAGVNVAVLDTGIDTTHPDLAANVVGGTNCSKGGRSYADGNGHGTHVAGIVAALDNGIGVVGVAPQAKLWSVRVLDDKGVGPTSNLICGVDFVDSRSPAKGGPIAVANMSLGGLGSDDGNCGKTNPDALHVAVCRAVADGVTFTVAAGNSGADVRQVQPAAYDEVITVSALADTDGQPCGLGAATSWGRDDTFATFSNFASSSDLGHMIAAPGLNINSTYRGGGYAMNSGTSMASPHVAGAVALYLASHPGASPASVRDALRSLGEAPSTNFNGECGSSSGKRGAVQSSYSHTDPSSFHPEVMLRADSL